MPRRLSRRPGPGHPVLFTDESDIPLPAEPIRPRAAEQMSVFRALLTAAEVVALAELTPRAVGRSVTVAGERRGRHESTSADLLLDDGTAVIGLTTGQNSARSMREALAARFLLVTGTVHDIDGDVQLLVEHARDLRALDREWRSRG